MDLAEMWWGWVAIIGVLTLVLVKGIKPVVLAILGLYKRLLVA
jgi:hypothetical protein